MEIVCVCVCVCSNNELEETKAIFENVVLLPAPTCRFHSNDRHLPYRFYGNDFQRHQLVPERLEDTFKNI